MFLQGDNNIFCTCQIYPTTRTEAVKRFNVQAMSKYIQLVFGLFSRNGFCPNTFRFQCVQQNILKLEVHERSAVANLCQLSLGTANVRRYVEPRSAHAIAYSVEKHKIPSRLRC